MKKRFTEEQTIGFQPEVDGPSNERCTVTQGTATIRVRLLVLAADRLRTNVLFLTEGNYQSQQN